MTNLCLCLLPGCCRQHVDACDSTAVCVEPGEARLHTAMGHPVGGVLHQGRDAHIRHKERTAEGTTAATHAGIKSLQNYVLSSSSYVFSISLSLSLFLFSLLSLSSLSLFYLPLLSLSLSLSIFSLPLSPISPSQSNHL